MPLRASTRLLRLIVDRPSTTFLKLKGEPEVMQRHYRITVPGLSVKRDFTAARQRLLADFPNVHEVIATTAAATLLVVYSGHEDPDAWLQTLRGPVAGRRVTATSRPRRQCAESGEGDDSAA
jgi:hypothetical protein